jgi:2-hydroxymuconate-semialdehyde hydrolase
MSTQDLQHATRDRLLDGLPLEERRLDVGGVTTSVLEGGKGPPVVLLHGGSQAGGVMWVRVLPRLTQRWRVVVPDLPGLGESEPVARLDAAAVSEWLARLLRLTCHDRPTLVAHSLPAGFAARFAAHHGERLRRLVLIGSPALGSFRPPPALLIAAMRLNLRPSQRNLERFSRWPYHRPDRIRAEHGEQQKALDTYLLSRAALPHVRRTMRQLMRTGTGRIPNRELESIAVPTALLWGRYDRMAPLSLAEAASASFGWPLHVIDEAGHLPHVEQPDAFINALGKILDAD